MGIMNIRTDSPNSGQVFSVSWQEDCQFRMHPKVVTELLREQVPALEFVDWKVTSIESGSCESVLPLNPQSTNQHFTHQAALFLLAADYTGGTALASLFRGWPVVGVHPVTSPESVAMWLLRAEVKYLKPSVGDLSITASIDPSDHDRIIRRFLAGKAVVETFPIYFRRGNEIVGEAALTYFARQSDKLRANGITDDKVNALYELKLTSSAELIAGVRALQHGTTVNDPYAAQMAGVHGMALAKRFCERSPQLGGMVAARTCHLDQAIMNFLASGGRNVVIVGVGWDMRPFRLPMPAGTKVFELDFPTTLAARRKRLADMRLDEPQGLQRVLLPIDVRTMPLSPILAEHMNFDEPAFIAWEGMNMYFQEHEVRGVLDGMKPALRHRDSLLWVDLVDRLAIEHPEQFPESVQNFMRGMQILGEPFTFGPESITRFMDSAGMRCLEVVPSDLLVNGKQDPVYSVYRFCVASVGSPKAALPATFQQARIDQRNRGPSKPHLDKDEKLRPTHSRAGGRRAARSPKSPK